MVTEKDEEKKRMKQYIVCLLYTSGATQPFFGMLALKKSNAFVMLLGIVFMAAGLIATPFCREFWSLLLFFGKMCIRDSHIPVSPAAPESRYAAGIITVSYTHLDVYKRQALGYFYYRSHGCAAAVRRRRKNGQTAIAE